MASKGNKGRQKRRKGAKASKSKGNQGSNHRPQQNHQRQKQSNPKPTAQRQQTAQTQHEQHQQQHAPPPTPPLPDPTIPSKHEEAKQPSPPQPENPKEWHDVTNLIDTITSTMTLGDMIHAKDFDLHASMSALEIGDGVLDNAMEERLLYFENILSDKPLMASLAAVETDHRQLLGTMDELIRRCWSFFNGSADQHSIYSSLFLYEDIRSHPAMPSNDALNLFIDAIKTCCGFARAIVKRSHITEEDEWSKMEEFKFDDFEQSRIDKLTSALIDKIKALNATGKLSENSDRKRLYRALTESQSASFSERECFGAMRCRFEMVAVLLNVVSRMYNISVFYAHHEEQRVQKEEEDQKRNANGDGNDSKRKKEGHSKPGQQGQSTKSNHKQSNPKKGGNPQRQKQKGKNRGKGKGGKNKGKQRGKGGGGGGGGHQKQQKGGSQQRQSRNQNQKQVANVHSNANAHPEIVDKALYILEHSPRSECTLPRDVVDVHKAKLFGLKELSSSLLRLVNQCSDTIAFGMADPPGFDDRLGGTKSTHAPRRQRVPSRADTFSALKAWCKCLRFVADLTKVTSYNGFIEFMDALNRMHECPNIVIRALTMMIAEQWAQHSNFLWSRKPLIHFIQLSFQEHDEWSRVWPWINKQYLGDYQTFFSRVETAVRDVMRQKMLHVTRQMDWTVRIVKNWQILQQESPEIDRLTELSYLDGFEAKYRQHLTMMDEYKPQKHPFSQWLVSKACDSQIDYILLHQHAEMRLFADYELEYMYFYLEYLFRVKSGIIEGAMRRFNKVDMDRVKGAFNPQYAEMIKRRKQKNRKKGGGNDDGGTSKVLPPKEPMSDAMWLMTEGQRCLCLGIFGIIQIFYGINDGQHTFMEWKGLSDRDDRKEGDLDDPTKRLGAEELRFNHRFNVFQHVEDPEPLDYERFRNGLYAYNRQINPNMNNKFAHCQQELTQALKLFRALQNEQTVKGLPSYQLDYVRDCAKVAIQNRIFVSMLHKRTKFNDGTALKVQHTFDVHPHYIVFSEVERQILPPANADGKAMVAALVDELGIEPMITDGDRPNVNESVVVMPPGVDDDEEPASEF